MQLYLTRLKQTPDIGGAVSKGTALEALQEQREEGRKDAAFDLKGSDLYRTIK